MAKFKMDAIEVASSIHKGDFSKLRGKSFEMCDNTDMGKKYTLNQLGTRVDQLGTRVDQLGTRVDQLVTRIDQLGTRIDQIGDALFKFIKATNARFDKLEKRVEDGFKQVNTRLDYIVSANKLKDLPKNK